MSVELSVHLTFVCERSEQAGYIEQLMKDLQALIICDSSYIETSTTESTRV